MVMSDSYNKLDNPVWHALAETHALFAIGNTEVRRYQPHVVAFAAYRHRAKGASEQLDSYIEIGEYFFIIGPLPVLKTNYVIEAVYPCLQMICEHPALSSVTENIEQMGEEHEQEMYELVNLVQPGFYKPGTRLMGDYFGIRQQGKLVALTGERICMSGLTEISAVVTHPDYTGKKYAQQLVAHIMNKNTAAGNIPFLHVTETNQRAITIYERLGFVKRRHIDFTKIKRVE